MQKKNSYLSLTLISIAYLVAIFRWQSNPPYLLYATILFAICYIAWGVLHHVRRGNLAFKVVLEYALVALLGVAIISTLLI